MSVQYVIPDYVYVTQNCRQLLARIFVASPSRRITMNEIKKHPWFLKNLPRELTEAAQSVYYRRQNAAGPVFCLQSVEDIMMIVREARTRGPSPRPLSGYGWPEDDKEEEEEEEDYEEEEYEEEEEDEDYEQIIARASAASPNGAPAAAAAAASASASGGAGRENSAEFLDYTFDFP